MIIGGYIKDIPKPHRRKFDDKRRKRRVRFSIAIYSGIGTHYYATLDEENNPIWDSSIDEDFPGNGVTGWREAWDDPGCKGRWRQNPFGTVELAQEWIRDTFAREFGRETHKLVRSGTANRTPKWCYKDGD